MGQARPPVYLASRAVPVLRECIVTVAWRGACGYDSASLRSRWRRRRRCCDGVSLRSRDARQAGGREEGAQASHSG